MLNGFLRCPDTKYLYACREGSLMSDNPHPNSKIHPTIYKDKDNYCRVWVKNSENKAKFVPVHKLVLSTYKPKPSNKHVVNHKNGKRDDNRLDNLEWVLPIENERHARIVLGKKMLGEKTSQHKLIKTEVREIKQKLKLGVSSIELANFYKVSKTCIYHIKKGNTWSHVEIG